MMFPRIHECISLCVKRHPRPKRNIIILKFLVQNLFDLSMEDRSRWTSRYLTFWFRNTIPTTAVDEDEEHVGTSLSGSSQSVTVWPHASRHLWRFLSPISMFSLMSAGRVRTSAESTDVLRIDVSGMSQETFDVGIALLAFPVRRLSIISRAPLDKKHVSSVEACAESLVDLHAMSHCGIDTAGILKATNLEVRAVSHNPSVESVHRCKDSLTVLHAAGKFCGLNNDGIMMARKLTKLVAADNPQITYVHMCAKTLLELDISGQCGVTQDGVSMAVRLTRLVARDNKDIIEVHFCSDSLTDLDASGSCGMGTAGISTSVNLTRLVANNNPRITCVHMCADSLTELHACGGSAGCRITNSGISEASNITKLHVDNNPWITSVHSCANTLRELSAAGCCGIDTEGLCSAAKLTTLNADGNSNNIRSFGECTSEVTTPLSSPSSYIHH